MKIMSFNVLCGGKDFRHWENRQTFVEAVIQSHRPDLFGLQEAHSGWMDAICSAFPNYAYVGVGRNDGKRDGEFSPVFYRKDRFELLDSNTFWLSETPQVPGKGWDAACIRICSYAKLCDKESGVIFVAMNTHLDHIGPVAMVNGMKLILQCAAQFHELPILMTGDFNNDPSSEVYDLALRNGFSDCRTAAPQLDDRATFHGFECPDSRDPARIIDYIFAKNYKAVTSFCVITDRPDGNLPSDHYPVLAQVDF